MHCNGGVVCALVEHDHSGAAIRLCGWRVEAIHELDEHFLEAGLVVVGVVPDECDHLAVTVGSLPAVAARLVHHSEAIPAVMHMGEALEEAWRLLSHQHRLVQ